MRARVRRVVIFGGTGRTGLLIVDAALRDGYEVTVAARRPEAVAAADARLPASANIVRADVTSRPSIDSALRGQDAIVLAVSARARRAGNLYSDAARNITGAAEDTPDLRTVVVSSGGVNRDDPALPFWYRRFVVPLVMKDLYDDMRAMESIIAASALGWTLVRASYLHDGPASGSYRVSDGTTPTRGWRLSRADLAQFTVDQLSSDRWLRRKPTLAS